MENNRSESVYHLITRLCQLHMQNSNETQKNQRVKKLRSRVYEILLYQRSYELKDPLWLRNCRDIQSQYLAWCFHLRLSGLNYVKTAQAIDDCLYRLKKLHVSSAHDEILLFLLRLRKMPAPQPSPTSAIPTSSCKYRVFNEEDFHLDKSYELKPWTMKYNHAAFILPHVECSKPQVKDNRDVKEQSTQKEPPQAMIPWENLHLMSFTARRTWEAYGNVSPEKEPPFISEADGNVYAMMDKWSYSTPMSEFERGVKDFFVVTKRELQAHLKLVVVGLCSKTYIQEGNSIILHPNASYDEFSRESLEKYSVLPTKCGTIYNRISSRVQQQKTSNRGFIIREFFNAIERYLLMYRISLVSTPDERSVHQFHQLVEQQSDHLFKVDVISSDTEALLGVSIIDYLFRCIATEADRSLVLLLLSFLNPCLRVYFLQFLQPWVMEGVVRDDYNEFFIYATHTYGANRDRYYWTRAYLVRYDLVPCFLDAHWERIFGCGKTMNMLKLCVAHSPICQYLCKEKPKLLHYCITADQLNQLNTFLRQYEMDIVVLRGNPFSVQKMMQMKHAQQLLFAKVALERRASTIRRIECQKVKAAQMQSEMKREQIEKLKSEYDAAVAVKAKARMLALERELAQEDALRKMREYEERLIKQEAKDIISHYTSLLNKADELNATFHSRCRDLESIQLVDETHEYLDGLNANDENESKDVQLSDNALPSEINSIGVQVSMPYPACPSTKDIGLQFGPVNEENELEIIGTKAQWQLNRDKILGSQICLGDDSSTTMVMEALNKEEPVELEMERIEAPVQESTENNNVMASNDNAESSKANVESKADERSALTLELGTRDVAWRTSFNFELSSMTSSFATPCIAFSSMYTPSDIDSSFNFDEESVLKVQGQFFDQYLDRCLHDSLDIHYDFIRNELLKYFAKELNCIEYFECLHHLYFLLDGEYSRNLSEGIFRRLYKITDASNIIHVCSFNNIIQHSLGASFASFDHIHKVSFCIQNEPEHFDLCDINALDCLSLMIDIKWPINIIIPLSTVKKYDEIFKFLMKVNRVSWVLSQMWLEMKIFARGCEHFALCHLSTQYQKLHLFRHSMLHFLQTFQRYIAEDVLQSNWAELLEALNRVHDIHDLYAMHTQYVKQIYFSCLLTKKSKPLRETVIKIFTVILKFYECFRLRSWTLHDNEYRHPNFMKMKDLFYNFMQLISHFLKIANKLTNAAIQPELCQLIDLLDANGFYSNTFLNSDYLQQYNQLTLC